MGLGLLSGFTGILMVSRVESGIEGESEFRITAEVQQGLRLVLAPVRMLFAGWVWFGGWLLVVGVLPERWLAGLALCAMAMYLPIAATFAVVLSLGDLVLHPFVGIRSLWTLRRRMPEMLLWSSGILGGAALMGTALRLGGDVGFGLAWVVWGVALLVVSQPWGLLVRTHQLELGFVAPGPGREYERGSGIDARKEPEFEQETGSVPSGPPTTAEQPTASPFLVREDEPVFDAWEGPSGLEEDESRGVRATLDPR
ncbi:MAG: hypothetical protein ACFB9M_19465 [Myxococcota bacterium]